MRNFVAGLILTCFLMVAFTGIAQAAPDNAGAKPIYLRVGFGTKSITEREYEVVGKQTVKTVEGKMVEVNVGEENKLGSFRVQVTPTFDSTNPDVVILTYKAWEVRFTLVNGKYEKQYVLFADKVSRVMRGTTTCSSERAVDRDVAVTITPLVTEEPVEIDK